MKFEVIKERGTWQFEGQLLNTGGSATASMVFHIFQESYLRAAAPTLTFHNIFRGSSEPIASRSTYSPIAERNEGNAV